MRKKIVAANWKMYKTENQVKSFLNQILKDFKEITEVEIVILPPACYLITLREILKNSNIKYGAQNFFWKDSGAFTGEISYAMLKDLGCEYAIVGHSERREHFLESDEIINLKLKAGLENQLKIILCVGETLQQREKGITFEIVQNQLKKDLENVKNLENLIIAYEPVWAIGTGKTATPNQAQEVHKFIRDTISKVYSKEIADKLPILYGGSIKPENIKELAKQPDIDGGLVGGASLESDSFKKIVLGCIPTW